MIGIADGHIPGCRPARVHVHLKKLVSGIAAALPLPTMGFHVHFIDPPNGDALDDNGIPVFLPATSEAQVHFIARLRGTGHWFSPVVAVVNDYTGHQTYSAIKHGASSVLNLAIPIEAQADRVRALAAPGTGAAAVVDMRTSPRVEGPPTHRPASPDEDSDVLAKLLCGDETVSAIARRFFCSERTMYRRIRALYDQLQVSSRGELRSLLAAERRAC